MSRQTRTYIQLESYRFLGGLLNSYTFHTIYDYLVNFINSDFPRSLPGNNSTDFHDCVSSPTACGQDDWRTDQSGVKYYHVVATKLGSTTTNTLTVENAQVCNSAGLVGAGNTTCYDTRIFSPLKGAGDGTVPRISADRGYVNESNRGLNAPNATVVHLDSNSLLFAENDLYEHNGMTKNPKTHDCILYWLNINPTPGNCPVITEIAQNDALSNTSDGARFLVSQDETPNNTISDQTELSQTNTNAEAYYVKLIGIPNVDVSDDLGNKLFKNDDFTFNPVQGLEEYKVIGNNSLFLTVMPLQNHFIDFQVGNSPVMIETVKGVGNEHPSLAVRYNDLVLPAGVKARLTVGLQNVVNLSFDSNGDGSFETPVNPTAILTGADANDVEAPILSLGFLREPNGGVSFSVMGQDSVSGIKQIMYSLDGVNYSNYQSPFAIAYSPNPIKVYAFADDNAGNRSGRYVKEFSFTPDLIAPIIAVNQNPDPNNLGWNNGDVVLNLSATDNVGGSGVKEINFSANGSQNIPNTVSSGSSISVPITVEGITNVFYRAVDYAGNAGVSNGLPIRIDKTAPITQGTYTISGQTATITLIPNDNLSGVKGLVYSVDGGSVQIYQGAFNIVGVGEHRISYFATDTAGNVEAEKTLTYTINSGPLTLSIIPVLQCVQENANNTYTAIFGYQNNNPYAGSIPIGSLNKITPATLIQNQTTNFQTGGVYNAFAVTFSNGTVTWHLTAPDGIERNAKASSKSNRCQ